MFFDLFFKRSLRGCLRSIFQHGLKINCRRNKGLKPLVYIDLWGVQSSNFGFISPARPLAMAKSLPLPFPQTSARDPDPLLSNGATFAVGRGLSHAAGRVSADRALVAIRAPAINLDKSSKIDAYEQNFDQGATENAKI
jgi:hypothetical protein